MISHTTTNNNHSSLENALILNRVRFIAINSQIILILLAKYYLQIQLPLLLLGFFIGMEVVFQVYAVWRTRYARRIKSQEILTNILFDSLILAALVYFSGGPNNPFIYLLLLSIALATLMLTARGLLLVASIQLVLYSLLNLYQRPLVLEVSSPLESFHLHLLGMWVNFVFTVILIAVFGWLTRQSMIKQEKKIQNLREKQLQDEQLLALGIMSASAAHELGTPLSTIAIIVDDLQHENFSTEVNNDLSLLTSQIASCRNIIKSLGDKSREAQESLHSKSRSEFMISEDKNITSNLKLSLQKVVENWLVYRPDIHFEQNWHEDISQLDIHLPISVEQAITNLLDNAADASIANQQDIVSMLCYLETNSLIIEIKDHGKGIPTELSQAHAKQYQETKKKDGLGWGLFLSNASIERIGGNIELQQSPHGGTLTRISLPMNPKL